MKVEKIAIRVYALIVKKDKILLSDEFWFDTPMTKFPGGGLEMGEGIRDCLLRELKEELKITPKSIDHFFTYEDLIVSEFISKTQVIPIYYLCEIEDNSQIEVSEYRYDFKKLENGAMRNRWIDLDLLDESEMTFKNDKLALRKLKDFLKIDKFGINQ